jgi:hypothetical protein
LQHSLWHPVSIALKEVSIDNPRNGRCRCRKQLASILGLHRRPSPAEIQKDRIEQPGINAALWLLAEK